MKKNNFKVLSKSRNDFYYKNDFDVYTIIFFKKCKNKFSQLKSI